MNKLEKLKLEMLEARELFQKFIDNHKRPMTPEEKEKQNLLRDSNSENLGEQVSGPETFIVELKTLEDAREMKNLDIKRSETYQAFVIEFKKKDWSHE